MKKIGGIQSVIIGAVLVLVACEKPHADMAFHELDPDFGGLQGGKTVKVGFGLPRYRFKAKMLYSP